GGDLLLEGHENRQPVGIGRTDLPFLTSLIQFPDEGSEPRAIRPWVELQPDCQRPRSAVERVEELMELSDDGLGGLFQRRELRQLPGQPDIDARTDVGGQEEPSRSGGRERTVLGRPNGDLAGAGHPFPIKDDTKPQEARCARSRFRRRERSVQDDRASASFVTDGEQWPVLIAIVLCQELLGHWSLRFPRRRCHGAPVTVWSVEPTPKAFSC